MQNTFYNYNRMHHNFDDEKKSNLKRNFIIALIVILISTVAYLVYKSYVYSKYPHTWEEIKLLEASIAPVKIAPTEPSGEVFENQDKLIYSNIGAAFEKEDPQMKAMASEVLQKEDLNLRTPITKAAPAKKEAPKKEESKPEQAQAVPAKKEPKNPFDLLEE